MSSQNGVDPAPAVKSEEATLTKILHSKMTRQECLQEGDRELVAYRISEIMVAAKELYTKDLPRLMAEKPDAEEGEVFEELAGLRMTFMHLRDLVTDFDEAFLDAMTHQREADGEDEESQEEQAEAEKE